MQSPEDASVIVDIDLSMVHASLSMFSTLVTDLVQEDPMNLATDQMVTKETEMEETVEMVEMVEMVEIVGVDLGKAGSNHLGNQVVWSKQAQRTNSQMYMVQTFPKFQPTHLHHPLVAINITRPMLKDSWCPTPQPQINITQISHSVTLKRTHMAHNGRTTIMVKIGAITIDCIAIYIFFIIGLLFYFITLTFMGLIPIIKLFYHPIILTQLINYILKLYTFFLILLALISYVPQKNKYTHC